MKKLISVIAISLTVATASIVLAYGPMHNNSWGDSSTGRFNHNFTADQQKQIEQVEQKFQQQLTEKEKAINSKTTELDTARQNDTTTIGQLNQLQNELNTLEQDYWQLRTTIDQEVGETIGTNYRTTSQWGTGYCSLHNNHQGRYCTGHNEHRGMQRGYNNDNMNYGSRNCWR